MTCLKAFQQALLLEPENGWIHFRLGVVYGRLFDEDPSQPMPLFARAISHWKQALALDPINTSGGDACSSMAHDWTSLTLFMTGSMRRDRNCWHVVRLLYL